MNNNDNILSNDLEMCTGFDNIQHISHTHKVTMRFLSLFRKKSCFRNEDKNMEQKGLIKEEESRNFSQGDSENSVGSLSDNIPNNDKVQENNKIDEGISTKKINNMLSTKSELLKEGKEIVELIQNDGGDLNYSIGRKENESDGEFENRQQQRQLLIDRYLDWAEYARLYIFKNQIIPTHYDEYMASYNFKSNRYGVWFVKKALRIIETCK